MSDPFAPKKRWNGWARLLSIDSWIDDRMYRLRSTSGEFLESLTIFSRRFRVYGFKKSLVELGCEGLTIGTAGAVLMLALAKPAFEDTEKNWRDRQEYSIEFLDRFGNVIGNRGVLHNDAEPVDSLPDHFVKAVMATEDRRFFNHFGIDFEVQLAAIYRRCGTHSVLSDNRSSHRALEPFFEQLLDFARVVFAVRRIAAAKCKNLFAVSSHSFCCCGVS